MHNQLFSENNDTIIVINRKNLFVTRKKSTKKSAPQLLSFILQKSSSQKFWMPIRKAYDAKKITIDWMTISGNLHHTVVF